MTKSLISHRLLVYDKNIIWWFYARFDNMHAFDIALDNDVIRYYSEFDRWVKLYFSGNIDEKNKSILDLTGVSEDYLDNPNFSYLATFLPIVNYDVNLLKILLGKENVDTESVLFNNRLERAKYWVNNYGEDYNVKLGFIGLTPKRIKKKEKIIKNKKCVPTARYINSSAKPTPILFFLIYYLFFNFFARKSPR